MSLFRSVGAAAIGIVILASHHADATLGAARARKTTLRVVLGTTEDGHATPLWLAVMRKRLSPPEFDSAAGITRPLGPAERAWIDLIQSRVAAWQRLLPALAERYAPLTAPGTVTIVLGNRGASDAFTHDSVTIGFDLTEMQTSYGNATLPDNPDLMDRLFRHEFMHVMQKPWLRAHPWPTSTPMQRALLDIWTEGLGNYESLSSHWKLANGQRPRIAADALAELEPRFVARMAALACASPERAMPLLRDLSSGPFAKKWGAVTPALWLDSEMAESEAAYHRFVVAGPLGVWDLAARHLSAPLRSVLREAQAADSICATGQGRSGSWQQH